MKFILTILITLFYSQTYASVKKYKIRQGTSIEVRTTDEYNINAVQNNSSDFKNIKFKELKTQRIEGRPMLPLFHLLLQADTEIQKDEINIEFSKSSQKFMGKLDYFKGTKCRCKNVEDVDFSLLEYHQENELISLEPYGDYRGKKIHRLTVRLGKQFNNSFEIFDDVRIKIPSRIEMLNSFGEFGSSNKLKYMTLIIGLPEFEDRLQQFIKSSSKEDRVFFFEKIKRGESKENIKAIISKYYQLNKINSVIFAGNDKLIPTHYVQTKFDSRTPSDYQYGIMGGSEDLIPDVFTSRMPFENEKELEIIIEKWSSLKGQIKINKMMGISSNEGTNPSDFEYMRNIINPVSASKGAKSLFLDQNNENSNKDYFNQQLEKGVQFISYIGHGSGFSWPSFNREYDIEDLEEIDKQGEMPVVLDIACQNGRFSGEGRIGENFIIGGAENRMIGASIYYGGSVDISWHPPAVMTVGISEYISKNNNIRISEALIYGHLYLINSDATQEEIIDNLQWYHLQGDPGTIIL